MLESVMKGSPMKTYFHCTLLGGGLFLMGAAAPLIAAPAPAPAYHLARKIALPGEGRWDYITVDSAAQRLYVSRSTHVNVVDLKTGTVVGDIPDTAGVHGIAIDPKSGHGFTSNGRSNTVTIFDLKTLAKVAEVAVGTGPDCIIFDPATKRVFTFNGRSNDATAIDGATGKVIGTVVLPGRPEYAVADGKGMIYNNIEDKSEVAAIDAKTLKVENVWPIAPGDGPSGIAMDIKARRVFSVCGNQKMTVLDADTGKLVATLAVGNGPDASAFDPALGIAFSPNGEDGTLNVVRESGPNQFHVLATVLTQAGARTMALDPKTHHVYLMTATMQPAPPADPAAPTGGTPPRRGVVPGSYVVLDFAP